MASNASQQQQQRLQEMVLDETALLADSLRLRSLSKEWTRETWESQFTEVRHPPDPDFRAKVVRQDEGQRLADTLQAVSVTRLTTIDCLE